MPRIDAISKRGSGGTGGGCATVLIGGFLGLFVLVGLGTGYFLSIRPLYLAFGARSWTPRSCEVISSRVVHGDETSRPEIVYRYYVGDRAYTADRYDFLPGSRSDSTVPDVVARHPPGAQFECYVDPDDPTRAVINRTPTWWYGFGLVFLVAFAGIPGGIGILMLRAGRRAAVGAPSPAAPAGPAADPRFASAFAQPGAGALVLAPTASPVAKLITIAIVCLFWNGIVGAFTFFEVHALLKGEGVAWFLTLFLVPFQLIGLALLWAVWHQLLALANPRPIVTLGSSAVTLGASIPFTWELKGAAHRVTTLKITLRGREEARYRQGTDTKTDTHVFHEETLVEASHATAIARGSGTLRVPPGSMHTFTAEHNKVIWTLQVDGAIPRWPDIDETFEVTVRPV